LRLGSAAARTLEFEFGMVDGGDDRARVRRRRFIR
jgi:hypothetical protein